MSSAQSEERELRRSTTKSAKDQRYREDEEEEEEEEEEDYDEEDGSKSKISKSSKAKNLASGKRADQNRKAQRAFRQRKDKYIKDLELRSQELDIANSLIIQLKEENDRLNEIAKSFHNRVGELERQLAHISAPQDQQRRASDYQPASPRNDEYYAQRPPPSRSGQQYNVGPQPGSVYSQSRGLI